LISFADQHEQTWEKLCAFLLALMFRGLILPGEVVWSSGEFSSLRTHSGGSLNAFFMRTYAACQKQISACAIDYEERRCKNSYWTSVSIRLRSEARFSCEW
jgi:hypothetical protein